MKEGEMNVWWCEEHECSGEKNCCESYLHDLSLEQDRGVGDEPITACRMVPMRLVPADALVVEKVDGEWPEWATSQSAFRTQIMGDGYPSLFPRTMAEILDALVQASQVGESGR